MHCKAKLRQNREISHLSCASNKLFLPSAKVNTAIRHSSILYLLQTQLHSSSQQTLSHYQRCYHLQNIHHSWLCKLNTDVSVLVEKIHIIIRSHQIKRDHDERNASKFFRNHTFIHCILWAKKNVPFYFCPYLRQLSTYFQIYFIGTLCRQFATVWSLYIPLHSKCVSALPCEI